MASKQQNKKKTTIEILIGYGLFCAIGLASRFIPAIFILFIAYGIAFPLMWALFTHSWTSLKLSKHNLTIALIWGTSAGLLWAIYTIIFFRQGKPLSPLWGLQMSLAFPIWLLIMSPFQEFFFRGWLQPRMVTLTGKWLGLILTSIVNVIWHFCPQLENTATSTLPLSSFFGVLSTFLSGMLFGYIHQRVENLVAPWLAHAIGGIAMVMIGEMTFLTFS